MYSLYEIRALLVGVAAFCGQDKILANTAYTKVLTSLMSVKDKQLRQCSQLWSTYLCCVDARAMPAIDV